jgi:hypothetical protein
MAADRRHIPTSADPLAINNKGSAIAPIFCVSQINKVMNPIINARIKLRLP